MAKTFNITPRPRMLLGVQNQNWKASGAMAELIDNSFGSGRGNADTVKIIYDSGKQTLTVLDNGVGMKYIGQLFQLGNTIGHTAGDIGHYGSGGTQAIIWLPTWVNVATCPETGGKIMHDHIRWSEIFEMEDFRDVAVSNDWRDGDFAQFSEFPHGTAIQMKLLPGRKLNLFNLIRDLSRLFAPGLRGDKKIIWCHKKDGKIIDEQALRDPFETPALPENTVHFNIVIEYTDKGKLAHLPVRGAVSFNDDTSHADSVIRIGFGYREIMRNRDCFKSGKVSYTGIGVSGWLDLGNGWQKYLTTTKDGINDDVLYGCLTDHVFKEIESLLKKADEKAIDFELDNIALNLQFALEKAMKIKVKVKPGEGPTEGGGIRTGAEIGVITDIKGNQKNKSTPDPEGKEKNAPGNTQIRLLKQTDEQMMGALAKSGEDTQGIYVDINTDHVFVIEALKAKPVNAKALNLMIVQEIATLLIEHPEIIKNAFKQSLIDDLERCEGNDKVRKLVRHLIDSVPDKYQDAAE